jgi:acyl-CoA reductase-like NAD-dependent aldehyde dehydrogenase
MNIDNKEGMSYGHLIGGKWKSENTDIAVLNKYTNAVYAYVGNASEKEVAEAIDHAYETFHSRCLTATERYTILMKAASLFEKKREEIALTITREAGKAIKEARLEVDRGIQTFIASAEEAKRIAGNGMPIHGQAGNEEKISFSIRVPVGVVCAITPFNFPFNLTAHKIGPAIAAGNTVILKPAEKTPVTAMLMAKTLEEAGLPAGFLNVVNGLGAEVGSHLMKDDRIAMFTFTGSPTVGRVIKQQTGIRKVTLELGNNSPNIIHNDVADLDRAVDLCVRRGFVNAGQACIAVQRIYVQRAIYEEVLQKAKVIANSISYGNPELDDTDMGPMISIDEAIRAETWIEEAVKEGAEILVGGNRENGLLAPTVLTNVTEEMKVVCEEVFAPVISIIPYDTIDEAFFAANRSKYGLQVGVFTSDLALTVRAMRELEFGGVNINDVSTFRADILPYGGVKDSGIGKEGPKVAIEEMTEEKVINIQP